MKLYADPISTTCRPILLFIADSGAPVEFHLIELMKGAHMQPEFIAINPSHAVPVLQDDEMVLTESSAILKYLADKVDSPLYPKDLKKRAKVNSMMDWLNTGLYRDFGYGFCYPQVFPHMKHEHEVAQTATINAGRERTKKWLNILDKDLIGPKNNYLVGNELTIADYFGIGIFSLADLMRCDLSSWPNIQRWLKNMRALPSWDKVHADFNAKLVQPSKEAPFVMF
jgi:glutathione S-transferase